MSRSLIIVGASTRAAAYSARRAGFAPWCVDLFADQDLQAIAPVYRVDAKDYPSGISPLIRDQAPHGPIIYTGGLENHPDLYLELAQLRPVWGYLHPDPITGADSVRNPLALSDCCQKAGIARPDISFDAGAIPTDGTWLCKPIRSAGGKQIAPWLGQGEVAPNHFYFQRFQTGDPYSASFVSDGKTTICLGITRQLIGTTWLHAPSPFAYCGNVGPVPQSESPQLWAACRRMGKVLVEFDPYLRGLFGVDFLWREDQAFVLEVNPRYTASMELLEWGDKSLQLMQWHEIAFSVNGLLDCNRQIASTFEECFAKGIMHAQDEFEFPESGHLSSQMAIDTTDMPRFADIPIGRSKIGKDQPVMTLVARGESESDALANLRGFAREVDAMLGFDY